MKTIPWAPGMAVNFDNHGSVWGTEPATQALLGIVEARLEGAPVDEWNVTDRDGSPLRIVRIADPGFLDTIVAIPDTTGTAVTL
ncbi:hypothetical protein GTY66_23545 [Streptomyces sp. SID8356]|uniref:hypothetical protein n=1 Tax=unclassified Streptomyces TaxID=2593676 RepID=UPI0003655D63|nr:MULTISPECIES: hypothetical protein [unclassified Streptomyces]MYT38988.1 hypothetical protein [Streptomyces sp. SID8356]